MASFASSTSLQASRNISSPNDWLARPFRNVGDLMREGRRGRGERMVHLLEEERSIIRKELDLSRLTREDVGNTEADRFIATYKAFKENVAIAAAYIQATTSDSGTQVEQENILEEESDTNEVAENVDVSTSNNSHSIGSVRITKRRRVEKRSIWREFFTLNRNISTNERGDKICEMKCLLESRDPTHSQILIMHRTSNLVRHIQVWHLADYELIMYVDELLMCFFTTNLLHT